MLFILWGKDTTELGETPTIKPASVSMHFVTVGRKKRLPFLWYNQAQGRASCDQCGEKKKDKRKVDRTKHWWRETDRKERCNEMLEWRSAECNPQQNEWEEARFMSSKVNRRSSLSLKLKQNKLVKLCVLPACCNSECSRISNPAARRSDWGSSASWGKWRECCYSMWETVNKSSVVS